MSLDLDRITHPLRLARGSHQPGSGKGCAMNVISYINGDTKITDYPSCSARPLARMVQSLNDHLAGADGFLSPENSVIVLDLGWLTVGTSDTPREVVWRWLTDLLVHPKMGVVTRVRREDVARSLRGAAALCKREACGERVTPAEWRIARDDARKAKEAAAADAYADADAYAAAAADACAAAAADACAAAYAYAYADAAAAAYAYAAAYAAAAAAAAAYAYADAFAAAAAAAAADAAADAYADAYARSARIAFTRWAIEHWRDLAGLGDCTDIDTPAVDSVLARIGG